VLLMPWAMIGAFGCVARNSFQTEGYLSGNSAFSTMLSGTSNSLNSREQPPHPRDAPMDRVFAKSLVHEKRVLLRLERDHVAFNRKWGRRSICGGRKLGAKSIGFDFAALPGWRAAQWVDDLVGAADLIIIDAAPHAEA